MSPVPYLIAGAVVAASLAWTIHLGSGVEPFAVDAGLTIAVGLVVLSVIDAAGLLLSRGRWSRRLGFALTGAGAALFVVTDATPASVAAGALTALAGVGLAGPWLDGWIRKRPAADGPGARPLAVVFGLLALVPLLGVAAPGGLSVWHGVLGGAAVALVWAYSRAKVWALWAIRLGLPLVTVPALVAGPWGGALLVAGAVFVIMAAAWSRESLLAVAPLYERLPGPRSGSPLTPPQAADE